MADRTIVLVPRRRQALTLLGITVAVVLVGVVATAVAKGLPGGGAQASQYRTALVASGTVSQTLTLSGTAARVGQVTVGWPMSGTVASVDVSVGQQVSQGQQLATMDTVALRQAVLDAQAQVDQARVTLDNDDSAASTSGSAASATSSPATGGSSGAAAPTGFSRGGSAPAGGLDTSKLTAATGAVDEAQQAAALACAPLLSHASATSPTSSGTQSPSSTSGTTTSEPPTSTTPSSSTTTSPTATGPTGAQVSACLTALQAVAEAQEQAGSTIDSLAASLTRAAAALSTAGAGSTAGSGSSAPAASGSSPASGSANGSANGSATSRSSGAAPGSEAKLILDQAALASAQAALTKAEDQLAAAVLTAPTSGVVGSVSLVAGSSTAANTGIVIVTPSAATVTVQVPQASLASVAVGQSATVAPAGGGAVSGSVSAISLLPTSSTSGSTATTYAVVVDVPQATDTLATGARASVSIQTSRVDGVLTVPVSAVTTVATGTGSVGVLQEGTVSRTTVRTGSVGQGKVQILSGLALGQSVVLADAAAALPTNNSGTGARVGAGALPGGSGLTGQGGAPPAAPPGR